MGIEHINPAGLYDGAPVGMSQATIETDSGLVFVSGQVDWNIHHQVENNTIEAQTEGAAKNLLTVLEAANSSVDNLLQLRVYVRGELGEHMDKIVPIIAKHLGKSRPALTGIGVASLATPDTLIEIEAVAKVSR
jgi:2-iminobutanoate/2-iminopropanoate deaminase